MALLRITTPGGSFYFVGWSSPRQSAQLSSRSSTAQQRAPASYRRRVLSLVEQIEEEATLLRVRTGARPLGRDALLAQDPHLRRAKIKKSPAPFTML